jgi:MFS family permease
MVAHCAGMVDLVALPVWVGALIAHYKFAPRQAGGLATLFLIGAVLSSLFFAPRFNRMNARLAVIGGFALAALAFFAAAWATDFPTLAVLHALAAESDRRVRGARPVRGVFGRHGGRRDCCRDFVSCGCRS